VDGVRDVLEQAERNGAYQCAPRALAVAKAHLEFAVVELDQGNPARAEDHFAIAEPNARAAFRLSPAARCAPRDVVVEPPRADRDGDGILDADDACPDVPEDMDGVEDTDGCPEEEDLDGDGISDGRDLCPLEPEDADGYLDTDGCPEPDNDLDTLLDASDRCTDEPEDMDGYRDDDGCPDLDNDSDRFLDVDDRCPNEPGVPEEQGCPPEGVQITTEAIRINQKIHFEFNRAVIRPESFGILDRVVQVLVAYPNITLEIQGHTDSQGADDYNLRLSDQRAQSVRVYLEEHGVPGTRLTSRGYGETRPIESNRTSAGRAANRRVEFIRTDSEAQEQEQP
jgi:outer membrane protein OmpA-like peptidoglycan-associated protein